MRVRLPLILFVGAVVCVAVSPAPLADETPQTQPQTQPQSRPAQSHAHDATVSHPFDDVNQWVGVFDDPDRARWQKPERITSAMGLRPGMAVADIGAGTGYFEKLFSDAVGPAGKVYAVDLEPKMVDHMKERAAREKTANVVVVLAAPDDPKLPDGGLDVIFICDTWHHINDRLNYLRTLAKALKPDGIVAIVDFQKRPLPVGPAPEHKLAREDVAAEFAEAGWTLARQSDALPYQYFLMFKPPSR